MHPLRESTVMKALCPVNSGWSPRFRAEGNDSKAFPYIRTKEMSRRHSIT